MKVYKNLCFIFLEAKILFTIMQVHFIYFGRLSPHMNEYISVVFNKKSIHSVYFVMNYVGFWGLFYFFLFWSCCLFIRPEKTCMMSWFSTFIYSLSVDFVVLFQCRQLLLSNILIYLSFYCIKILNYDTHFITQFYPSLSCSIKYFSYLDFMTTTSNFLKTLHECNQEQQMNWSCKWIH